MDSTTDQSAPPPPPPPPNHQTRQLRRDPHDRMLGGVASGLADYLGIDPVVLRIGFVLLALLGGFGVVVYLAAWLLMPEQGRERSAAQQAFVEVGSRRHPLVVTLLVGLLILVGLGLLSAGPWWDPGWHFGFGLGWFALIVIVVILALRRSSGAPRVGRIVGYSAMAMVILAIVCVGALFAAEALTGVPLRGGIGDRQWQPTNASQVARTYRLALGNLTIDLRGVQFPAGTSQVTASVGIGHLLVEVPPGLQVSVTAHSGIGVVTYGNDQSSATFGAAPNSTTAGIRSGGSPRLVLSAETGIGEVQLVRGYPPALSGPPA